VDFEINQPRLRKGRIYSRSEYGLAQGVRCRVQELSGYELFLITLLTILALAAEWFIGQLININLAALATYVTYLWVLYVRDKRFILEFFWLITMASLNIVGAFCCDGGLFLVELSYTSWYVCAVVPLVTLYIIMFAAIEMFRLSREIVGAEIAMSPNRDKNKYNWILLVGTTIAVYLFAQVAVNPYFSVGTLRLDYASQYMSSFSVSLRTYLPFFLPVVVMAWRSGCRMLPIVFILVTFGFYFLEGDKFGAYFFAAFVLALAALPSLDEKKISAIVKVLFIFFWLLIGIVYIQRVLLFDNTFTEFVDVIIQRLAQQGEVWWSIFMHGGGAPLPSVDISSEINAILAPATQSSYDFGQWRMMRVSCDYSAYSAYRIEAGNPYTSTTTASIVTYFGYFGAVIFYAVSGWVYAALIYNASRAFDSCRVLESMIFVKLISIGGNILFASDLTYLLSLQGAFYVCALFALTVLREYRSAKGFSKDAERKLSRGSGCL
jgi:hypothetical protein